MSSNPHATAINPALSQAQHKAGLWADDSLQVYAVMMGSRIPDLPALLAAADLGDFDCLLPGALAPEVQRNAPYLARLKRDSAFTDWLLFEAAAGLGDWGVLVRSPAKLLALRGHLRGLLRAQIPGGQAIALDWMDPLILQALLPLFGPAELAAFMGPLQSLVIPNASVWTAAHFNLGQLEMRSVPVAKAA
jgi:hypothetical protein